MVKLVGTGGNQVPTNNMLGNMAFQNKEGVSIDLLGLAAGTAAAPSLIPTGDPNTGMWFPAADTIAWSTGGSERTRIDASGRFLFGADTAILSGFQGAGFTPSFQLHGATGSAASSGLFNWSSGASSPYTITFNKSISGIVGTRGALTGGTSLANLVFNGDNGTTFSTAAAISASIDATPSPTSMPGRIEFYTTPTGSLTSLERMRIRASGNVGIGTTVPDALLSVNGIASFGAGAAATPSIAAFGDLNTGMWFPAADTIAWSTGGTERLRIASGGTVSTTGTLTVASGAVSIGSTSFDFVSSATFSPQIVLVNTANDAFGPFWNTRKLRGAAAANSGDQLGSFVFQSVDTGGALRNAATFSAVSEGAGATFHSSYFSYSVTSTTGTSVIPLAVRSQGLFVVDGTALLPSFTFANDPNTGFWRPAADTIAWSTNGSERLRITDTGNLGLGTSTFGTSAATVLAIATGTAPTTGPADTIQIYSTDLTAGNTMLSLYTEGTIVNTNTTAATTHRIAIRVNGTVYYLLANTAA
jgi:hypothetical protein